MFVMDWIELGLAMGMFLASHRIPSALGVKAKLLATLGPRGYAIAFSVISTVLLGWAIVAAGRAPLVPLWDHALWHRWLVNLVMPLAIALTVFGTFAANPFAFEGRAAGFDPAHPGIAGLTRQPLLWALALWSGAHLVANGDLAHLILFGPFLILALIGMAMIETRRRRAMGLAEWQRLTARTSRLPFAALLRGRWRPQAWPNLGRLGLTLMVWAGLWSLHAPVIGATPAP